MTVEIGFALKHVGTGVTIVWFFPSVWCVLKRCDCWNWIYNETCWHKGHNYLVFPLCGIKNACRDWWIELMQCHEWSKLWWNELDLMIYLAFFSSLTTQTSLLPFPKLFLDIVESIKIPQMIWNESNILARFHYSTCLVSLFDVHCTKVGWWLACFGNGESKREFSKSLMVGFVLQCSFCISLWKVNRRKDFFLRGCHHQGWDGQDVEVLSVRDGQDV